MPPLVEFGRKPEQIWSVVGFGSRHGVDGIKLRVLEYPLPASKKFASGQWLEDQSRDGTWLARRSRRTMRRCNNGNSELGLVMIVPKLLVRPVAMAVMPNSLAQVS